MDLPETSSPFARLFVRWMYVIAVFGNAFFYIQAYEIFRDEAAVNVSTLGFCVAFVTVASWFVYGLILKNKVMIIANIVAMVGAALVVIGTLAYPSA
ncbi:MAG: SemiSWEET family transporter [Planctomycetota bacterium]|jgi:MtN3 and saliva related transmembrane protein